MNPTEYDDIVVLKGQSATLRLNNPNGGTYDFYATNPANGALPVLSNSSGEFVTASLDADTTLYVILRKGDCSSAIAAVNIKVLPTQLLIVPNAFSPNGDGHNDVFRVKNPQPVQKFEMAIFDRWGEKVFETTDLCSGWNGFRGGDLASGGITPGISRPVDW